jgi:argininosuccinate synthase
MVQRGELLHPRAVDVHVLYQVLPENRTPRYLFCSRIVQTATLTTCSKGNDQVRFELAFYAIQPSIKIIAPWRESRFFDRFQGRNDLLDYAAETGLPVTSTKAKPWSMDANLAHCSYEAGVLENPNQSPPNDMWTMTDDPLKAPNEPTDITISFQKGIPTKLVTPQKTFTDSVQLFKELNRIGKVHGM